MMPLQDAVDELVTPPPEAQAVPEVDEPEPESDAAAPGSVLAVLRERARQLREQQYVNLDVPGYDGYLVARYRAVSIARVFAGRTDVTALNPDTPLAADTLGQAIEDIYMRDSPDGDDLYPTLQGSECTL